MAPGRGSEGWLAYHIPIIQFVSMHSICSNIRRILNHNITALFHFMFLIIRNITASLFRMIMLIVHFKCVMYTRRQDSREMNYINHMVGIPGVRHRRLWCSAWPAVRCL